MAKGRSPNYPSTTLREAIDRIRLVYAREHTHKTDKNVVVTALGYTGLNGKSLTLLGTLKRYGLLETDGDGLKVSEEAVTILELSADDSARVEAVERAAFHPELFKELRDTFGSSLPSDDNLRHYLIKKAFLPKAASDVIRIYRDNLELVSEQKAGYNDSMKTASAPFPVEQPVQVFADRISALPATSTAKLPPQESTHELKFRLSADSAATIFFSGEVTQEAFELLGEMLEIQKKTFPKAADLKESEDGE